MSDGARDTVMAQQEETGLDDDPIGAGESRGCGVISDWMSDKTRQMTVPTYTAESSQQSLPGEGKSQSIYFPTDI
jgi:hypothetical protein